MRSAVVGFAGRRTEVLIRAAKSYSAHRCSILAGGITYYALVSLFPLTLFALSVAGFVWADPADREALIDHVLNAIPLDAEAGRGDLEQVMNSVVRARGPLGLIGLVSAAYAGSALFAAVRTTLNQVFEVEDARPFLRGKLLDLGMVLGFGMLLLLSVAATFAIAIAARFASEVAGAQAAALIRWSSALLYLLLPTTISAVIFLLLYSKVAHAGVTWREAMGGTLVAALIFELLKVGFAEYITAFGNYDATYGTLGFVIILLLFFFFSAQVMLFGAEVVRADREYAHQPSLREIQSIRASIRSLALRLPGVRRRIAPKVPRSLSEAAARTRSEEPPTQDRSPRVVSEQSPDASARTPQDRPAERRPHRLAFVLYLLVLGALIVAAIRRDRDHPQDA